MSGECDEAVKRSPLAYSDILKTNNVNRAVRKVLVEGDAGIGKTTLCTALSEDWANEKVFQEFEILLLLHLRQNRIASAGSLLALLNLLHPSQKVCELVAEYIEDQEGKVLIIADGWDELSTEDRSKGSFLYELLFGECYSLSVIVTSRPSSSVPFHELRCIDRFVEVHGFNNDNIKEFIQCEFTSDRAKGSGLLAQLESNLLIESVCSVPLNCAIVCHLWDCFDGALPTTMSELYTKIILNIILRNIRKKSEYESIPSLPHFDSLPSSLEQPWSLLCELAFQTLSKDKIVFSHEDLGINLTLESEIFSFGLLQSAESVLVDGHGVSFHFLHLTFQEYLAALYLVRQPTDKQLQLCQSHAGSKRFEIVWRFFFGLSFLVCNKPVGVDVSKLLVDAYCIYGYDMGTPCHFALEANQRTIIDLIASKIINFSDVWFEAHVAFDSVAIIHVITNLQVCHCGINISLRDCGLRDEQITALADALAGKHSNLRVKRIDLSGNRLTDEGLAVLFERASLAFSQSLGFIFLSNNMVSPKAVNSLVSVLEKSFSEIRHPSNPFDDYTWLDISDSPLGVDGCKTLRDALCTNKLAYLKCLSLAGSLTGDADINAELILALGSGHMCSLEALDLSRNNLGAPGGKALGKILSDLHVHFHVLTLTETMLGNEGVAAFSQNLNDTVSRLLECIHLDNNDIQAAGISCLAESMSTGRLLLKCDGYLILANNPLGLEGVTDVVEILTSNHFQADCIDLSGCQLTTAGGSATNSDLNAVGVQQLICSQQRRATHSNLMTLALDNNNFSGEGVHILAAFMYTCQKNVSELFCRSCGITSNDLKQLLVLLSKLKLTLSHLDSWNLSDNNIDDDGVSILIQHLSIFPALSSTDITLDGNVQISPGMVKTLEEELEARLVH
jgi:Ran GTPase-activating protein (RanGAP) involved in mRNA processing and transport